MPLCYVESLSWFRLQFFDLWPFLKMANFWKIPCTIAHGFFFKKWLRNHPQFLLHFLIHIDVLMLCRKFELIPTSIFRFMAIFKNGQFSKNTLYYSPWFFFKKWLRNHPQFLLHFLIYIDVLMLCRKFELNLSSIFQVMAIFKNRPIFEKYPEVL